MSRLIRYATARNPNTIMAGKATEGVRELVSDVLATVKRPYGEDITEDVCVAIEKSHEWKQRYDELAADLRHWVVNNWIGQYVLQLSGMKSLRQVPATRTTLVKSYKKLAHS